MMRESLQALLRDARLATDTATLIRLSREWRHSSAQLSFPVRKRLALLSGATTATLAPLLEVATAARGLGVDLWQGTHGAYVQDALEAAAGPLSDFQPDIVHFVLGPYALEGSPPIGADPTTVSEAAGREGERLLRLAQGVQAATGAIVVLDNLPEPAIDPLGGSAGLIPSSRTAFTRSVNHWLATHREQGIHVHDVWRLAAEHGTWTWLEPRDWLRSKQPVSLASMGGYVQSLAALLAAVSGRSSKLLAVDLDGTLWGGTVGEEGVPGIRLGEGSAEGEAFKAFQQYCRELRERGVLLAVCSKNDETVARAPFETHPESVLRLSDFVAFKANWEAKAQNLVAIAQEVGIGLESCVFCDNDPFERAVVSELLPEVVVVPMPDDPAEFGRAVAATRSFDTVGLQREDLARTQSYHASMLLRGSGIPDAADLDAFLAGLRMEALVRPFNETDLPRIAELVAKSNQFNLTARRHAPSRLRQLGEDTAGICFTLRLRDRLADHGLVAVVAATPGEEGRLDIDTWVMSCRVLKRGVEVFTLRYICERARALGYACLRGIYSPTERNGLVRSLYQDLGFTPETDSPTDSWLLPVGEVSGLACHVAKVDDFHG